jgi:hypothetical protein
LVYTSRGDQLSQLLLTSIEQLDITDEEYRLAVSRYEAVGQSLAQYWEQDPATGLIYPQGSMRLGTVTRNIHRDDEIDIDLVARRDRDPASITQAELKADTGHALDLFIKTSPEGQPSKDEGKRCWTLHYPGFHVDVLPALPDGNAAGTGIIITDTQVRGWLPSDPVGYADWFHGTMRADWTEIRKAADVETVPDWAVKTMLQRAVQALKRHRDMYFTEDLDQRPASIIITTLAARAYRGGGSLFEVLRDVTATMPDLVDESGGVYVVANPVQPAENFADRWRHHPQRVQRFFDWVEQAHADFADLGAERGTDTVLGKIAKALGDRPAERAERAAGSGLLEARRAGNLRMAAVTGALTGAASGRLVRPHSFHGDDCTRR